MNTFVAVIALAIVACSGEPVPAPAQGLRCDVRHPAAGLSDRYFETIGHAIHSMTSEALSLFKAVVSPRNSIPTVNMNLKAARKVLGSAPSDPVGHDFYSPEMNLVDHVLSGVGVTDDGLGANWSPVERLVHHFHMMDLWLKIKTVYDKTEVDEKVCSCLSNVAGNGIRGAVEWVARHYATGTPITLLNRDIPKLTDAKSWGIWKDRLLHYYTQEALQDAAYFLKCSL